QDAIGKAAGARSDFVVAFEEESFDLGALACDLESERHLGAAGDDPGIPEAVDRRGGVKRCSKGKSRQGDDQRGQQQPLHEPLLWNVLPWRPIDSSCPEETTTSVSVVRAQTQPRQARQWRE